MADAPGRLPLGVEAHASGAVKELRGTVLYSRTVKQIPCSDSRQARRNSQNL